MKRPLRTLSATFALVLGLGLAAFAWQGWSGRPGAEPALAQHRFSAREMLPAGRDPIRIVALGTSLTRNALWPDELARVLAACADRPVLVSRIARAGATSAWGQAQVPAVAAQAPDLVLIEFAINDADLRDGQSLQAALAAHQRLLDALAAAAPDARPVLMTMNPAFGLRGVLRPWLGAHNAQYRRLAEARDIGLIDLAPLWWAALVQRQDRGSLLPDGLHPTDAAVGAVVFAAIAAEVGRRLPGCA